MDVNEMNLSLNGCGYVGIYHVGVCSCIKKYYPQVFQNEISGGSVGALVACAFMCDVPLETCTKYVFDVSMKVRNGILGPMSPDLNIMKVLYESMDAMLPDDAHLHCDGKLHVSVTRFDNGKNVLLNSFSSREELLQALMCSCFIPVYCGYEPPVFHGVAYVDAALSNNSPLLNKSTVTVAPFSGNSDICPENDGLLMKSLTLSNTNIRLTAKNLYMMFRVLFPGSPDIQKEFCQKGFNDALRFLRDNGLLPCSNCVADKFGLHSKCKSPECLMPKEIANEIENAIELFRKNFGYRMFQYRSVKILYYLNMPSIVTAKIVYLAISAILQKVQNKAGSCMDDLWSHFLQILKDSFYRQNSSSKFPIEANGSAKVDYLKSNDPDTRQTVSMLDQREYNYTAVVCSDGYPNDTENSNTSFDVMIDVPQSAENKCECNAYSVQQSHDNTRQLEHPLCESKGEGQVNGIRNTYVYTGKLYNPSLV